MVIYSCFEDAFYPFVAIYFRTGRKRIPLGVVSPSAVRNGEHK